MTGLRERTTTALRTAMRARDRTAASTLRTLLGAFDNAAAVPTTSRAGAVEESPVGVGSAEAVRRDLTEADLEAIRRRELAEVEHALATVPAAAGPDHVEELRRRAQLLRDLGPDA